MPTPDHLRAIRVHLLDHHERFRKIIAAPALKRVFGGVQGEALSRPPKGFPCDHPAIDLIRMKQFLLWRELDPKVALGPMLFVEVMTAFEVMAPTVEFLNEPMVLALQKSDKRWLA